MVDGDDGLGMGHARLGRVGFESGADVYERARPGYPDAAVAHLVGRAGIGPGRLIVDLAAGTGKFTRQLLALGATCLAIEPSATMREVFVRTVPDTPVIGATAEQIPIASGTVDTVIAAQAFHWFEAPTSLAEIARVLRPGGWLGLIWNERDESDPVIAELVRVSKWDRFAPYPADRDFGADVTRSRLFGPVERTRFNWVQWVDRETFVEQVASRSYVRVLAPPERQTLLDEVAAFGAGLAEPIPISYRTSLYCAQLAG